ncbi:hypothetical protein VC83_06629 [Pseudogymnoascus destructans]|uniref:LYR motif-containing protein Cup1-like N-terminal domain-containing protein n=2 Tax=Pseudogymnoascus destructans TaxID=655981 RepID=L8FR02_PSED2|nr:uncharacterized protein VC83_06629 [Pseudogymnoascus destructans]ELR02091.1 hypothetical protein GMDG_05251 [Pseudogymnoascus destructans 20631-21]OAF56449.1 hypothetical protein VC83_06629 [Pseudogymnoascus destructans]
MTTTTTTTTTNLTHLLRALLRACSYLPDGPSRHYFHARILHRFRHVTTPTLGAYRARRALSFLTRATNGDLPALTKVLQHTYGRAGQRRHTLLNTLLSKFSIHDDAEQPTAVSPAVQRVLVPPTEVAPRGGAMVPAKPHDAPPTVFERLLADQILQYPPRSNRSQLKMAYAPIPLENVFLRPTAAKREARLRKRWLTDTMERILPPLPEEEWDKLRGLATGVVEWEGAPKRRARVGLEEEGGGRLLSVEYLKAPIRHAHSKVRKVEIDQRDRHELTPKYMQRMYAKIWELCPKARWDEELRDWVYTWGGTKIAANRGEPKKVAQRDLSLFEGIEDLDKGHVNAKKRNPAKGKVIPQEDIDSREAVPSND